MASPVPVVRTAAGKAGGTTAYVELIDAYRQNPIARVAASSAAVVAGTRPKTEARTQRARALPRSAARNLQRLARLEASAWGPRQSKAG